MFRHSENKMESNIQCSSNFEIYSSIKTFFQSLLSDPNPLSPANPEASSMYVENRAEYNRIVSELVKKTWEDEEGDEQQYYINYRY